MHVAAIQMVSSPVVPVNLDEAAPLIASAVSRGAELVLLPEYFCQMGAGDRDKLHIGETEGDGPIQRWLAEQAARHSIWLVGGSMPLRRPGDPDHVTNSTLVFDPEGRQVARYDKIHLFRFSDGERRYDESTTQCAGSQPIAFEARSRSGATLRIGLSICYDLRFPELYRQLSLNPCDLLLVPAAFTDTTGEAHWELLLRARAVENQCHVLACGQGGLHANGRRTWGHSMLIDPWGRVLDVLPEGAGIAAGQVDLNLQRDIRTRLPALEHRRL
jgi:nitrilase